MMNPLKWLLRTYPPQPVTWETVFGSSLTRLTGVEVSEYSALNYSPIWSGVATLSRDIAKLPLVLYRNLQNGGKERFSDHKLYRILHDEPNPEMTSFKFRETMQALCILYGNAYAEIVRDGMNRVAGLYPILPSRVTPYRDERSGRLLYRVSNPSGGQSILTPERMIHLSSLSLDGVIGQSLVAHASESIGLGVAAEQFGAAFFGNGSTFGGTVEIPGALTEAAKDNLRKLIESVHQGVERAHKILVLANGAKFTERGTPPNNAQYIETRKFQIQEVARWLNMPPHKLGDLENAHFTNIEEQELQYYVGCVSGWLKMWEQELTRKLISPLEYNQQTIEHVLEGVLRGDSTKRAAFYDSMVKMGAFTINDVLRKENMNPIPDGNMHFVPLNMIPIERLTEYIDVKLMEPPKAQGQIGAGEGNPPGLTEDKNDARWEEIKAEIRKFTERDAEREAEKLRLADEVKAARERADAEGTEKRALQQQVEDMAARVAEAETRKLEAEAREADAAQQALLHRTAAEAAEAARLKAEQDIEAKDAEVRTVTARIETADATLQAAQERSAALHAAAQAETEAARADIETARRELEAKEAALREASTALETANTEATAAATKAAELEAALEQQKQTERDRMAAVVSAHRELIADAVRRIARTETERARKRGSNPETLRKWLDAFYDEDGRETCAEILYPAVRANLAWRHSEANPYDVARSLAATYCEQSERQLRALTDGMVGEEFQQALTKLLSRWEHERPMVVADTVLQESIRHLTNG